MLCFQFLYSLSYNLGSCVDIVLVMMSDTRMKKLTEQRFLITSLLAISAGIIVANITSDDTARQFAGWSYIFTAGSVVVLALLTVSRTRFVGSHGKAWVLFAGFAILWFVAEQLWNVYELIIDIDPYPSAADVFWIMGYPLYFGFLVFYLKPFRQMISKKMVITASLMSLVLVIPSFYLSYNYEDRGDIDFLLGLTYPVLDSIVFAPALMGVSLFFKGQVNFLWTLMCLAILSIVAADTAFLFITSFSEYDSGDPVEILFHWGYILFAFGIYDHYKAFRGVDNSRTNHRLLE